MLLAANVILIGFGGAFLLFALFIGWMALTTKPTGEGTKAPKATATDLTVVAGLPARTREDLTPRMLLNIKGYIRDPDELPRTSRWGSFELLLGALNHPFPVLHPINAQDPQPGMSFLVEHRQLEKVREHLERARGEGREAFVRGLVDVTGWEQEAVVMEVERGFADGAAAPSEPNLVGEVVALVAPLLHAAEVCEASNLSLFVNYRGKLNEGGPRSEENAAVLERLDGAPFEQVAPHLRARLRDRESIEANQAKEKPEVLPFVYRDEDLPGTMTTLELDLPYSCVTVSREQTERWGKSDDELFEVALANVLEHHPLGEHQQTLAAGDLEVQVFGPDPYITAHALMLAENPGLSGPMVFALPDRDHLLVLPHPESQAGDDAEEVLSVQTAALISVMEYYHREDRRPVSEASYYKDADGKVSATFPAAEGEEAPTPNFGMDKPIL